MPQAQHKRHTIYEVAAAAGVSIATVSRVISRPEVVAASTRTRVLAAIDALNYVPDGAARSLAARQNEAVAVALPELNGPYYAELLSGFESAASEIGASIVLTLTRGKPSVDAELRRLAGRVDALAIHSGTGVSAATLESLHRKVPVVVVAGPRHPHITTLSTENVESASRLTGHLIDTHQRRQLLFVGDPTAADDIAGRYLGFRAAHASRGLTAPEPLRCEAVEAEGRRVAAFLAAGELTADGLVCANDELALALVHELNRSGLDVPGRISVTGWDDMMAARYLTPGLSTVRQPVRDLGELVVNHISHLLGHREEPVAPRRLATSVILRQSCGCS